MRLFAEAFPTLNKGSNCYAVLKNSYVENVRFFKNSRQLALDLVLDKEVSRSDVEMFKNEILKMLKEVKGVLVNIRYNFAKRSAESIVDDFWKDLAEYVREKSPLFYSAVLACEKQIVNSNLILGVDPSYLYYMKKKGIDKVVECFFENKFGLKLNVVFEESSYCPNEIDNNKQNELKLLREFIVVPETPKEKNQNVNSNSEIIIGKPFGGSLMKIQDVKTEGELVILEGQVLNVEARELKSGEKYIVTFDITDKTDSTAVKFFVKKELYETSVINTLKKGMYVKVKGELQYDKYSKELNVMARDVMKAQSPPEKMDLAEVKRVELHLHTQMSSMDGITSVKDYFQRASKWGHKAVAITDHGVVQAFPEAMDAAKKYGVKAIYGMEAYIVDDLGAVVQCPKNQSIDDTYVVFDIETTGLLKERDRIIEIGAIKIKNGEIVETFSRLINPHYMLPNEIVELTHITDEMLTYAKDAEEVLPEFLEFVKDAIVVAHNADFDVGFIRWQAAELGLGSFENTVVDTLELSRILFPKITRHKLNLVCEHLGISLENHHRALDDAGATAKILLKCIEILKEKQVTTLEQINTLAREKVDYKKLKSYHAVILAKNLTGLRNLYELVSLAHIDYFYKRPRILKSMFVKLREGLIIGTACEAGELYKAVLNKAPEKLIRDLVNFYDYLEIQPLDNNMFLIGKQQVFDRNELISINKKIVDLGEKYNKPVVATCDVHFLNEDDAIFRQIIMMAEGFSDTDNRTPLYYRTTEEMLNEFSYLGKEKAYEVVVTNTNLISDMTENILPIPNETFPPQIEGAEEQLIEIATKKAISIYGEPLPKIVNDRLEKELNSIIKNGFSVMYIIAQKLVWKSLEEGYLVGSRGSVGSSFVATMANITEVNPLPPHYICPKCKYSDFESEEVLFYGGRSGCDMPDKKCPECGEMLIKDGHDIQFETFLGFDGDKEPDIDLNFSGEYQQYAHQYTEVLFGAGNVFKAGTIGTLAEKTAYGFVKKYLEAKNKTLHNSEVNRLISGCTGIKRTTGQHPGGLMILPAGHSIYEFCPVQRPANDIKSSVTTTHFDYHSISGRLLKLDLLGHDDPTVIRMLYDITGVNPQNVPLDDKETMSLFTSTKALKIQPSQINSEIGSIGLPEFGTKFVRQMLIDTMPTTFAELIRIAGLSHGTDVWLNNAQDLVRSNTAELKDVISTRDDIMVYLISKGLEKKLAFKIMENVRKGKGLSDTDEEAMRSNKVPEWYILSCKRIQYLFPKAHAAAYVMMAFRIAYFKVHYPTAFYASYYTVRADDFDYMTMCRGEQVVRDNIRELESLGNIMTAKEKNKLTILEVVLEMYARGFNFLPLDLYKSDSEKFKAEGSCILPPFNSIQGLGITAAKSIVQARSDEEFFSIEEFAKRTSVSKTVIALLRENGVFRGMTETAQLSLFA